MKRKQVKATKVLLSERAVVARINRALKKDNETLRRCREDSRSFIQLGKYYIVDLSNNTIAYMDIDLETIGRKLKVLADWETVESVEN